MNTFLENEALQILVCKHLSTTYTVYSGSYRRRTKNKLMTVRSKWSSEVIFTGNEIFETLSMPKVIVRFTSNV